MYGLRRAIVWITRCHRCRGFGVHSPWAFRLINEVINERRPYHAYAELEQMASCDGKERLRLCRLYFRLSNFFQPKTIVDYAPHDPAYGVYMAAACSQADVTPILGDLTDRDRQALDEVETIDLLRMSVEGDWRRFYTLAREKAHDGSAFIIEGIKKSRDARSLWREIKIDEGCTLTFDLYYCGIVYFDSKRYKHHYIVNF